MNTKDQQITALNMKIQELETDKASLLRHLEYCTDLVLKAYARDAECPYCQRKHWEMHEHTCF